ncbi:hypothetical protein GWI33_016609 [Rhynchophorus ferrugineus]|uniref:Uncharacterized protein n=1 Tax=Rhynchophorus ferrugineus TaxID=354439 RepID=A0A834HYA5_RHYFE|nr:hypothetical protein GWI33_016609 [Rhynchophorus ferrugineus]
MRARSGKLKAASPKDRRRAASSASAARRYADDSAGPLSYLNATPVCRYKEKASSRWSKWMGIDKGTPGRPAKFKLRHVEISPVFFCRGGGAEGNYYVCASLYLETAAQ